MRVLVVGAGGLGCPALLGLAHRWAAESRPPLRITVWDPDRIEESNLHRQLLFRTDDVGRPKAPTAAAALRRRWPQLRVEGEARAFRSADRERLTEFDLVLDGTDQFEIKLALNDACVQAGVRWVFAAASSWSGQVMAIHPDAACLRCVFGQGLLPGTGPTCDVVGVYGPLLGRVAARQVDTAWRLLRGAAVDGLWMRDRDHEITLSTGRRADCGGCGLASSRPTGVGPSPPEPEPAPEVDLTALRCPHTFVETRRRLERLPVGACLWVAIGSDESARSVPASAVAAGHRVVAQRSDGVVHRILLQRGV
jgi:molybdopterin/thiamine biosynthesis adenylyltransferase/TusA-related sulfurtransferase